MPTLDTRGIIAAAQTGVYVPISIVTAALVFRYAFRRDAGWFFLFIFALTRVAGGALLVAAELVKPSKIDLFIAAYILQAAGLAPLLLSTIGFLGQIGQSTYSERIRVSIIFRSFGALSIVGLGLTIAGGLLGTHVVPGKGGIGLILRRVGTGVFAGLYMLLFLAHFGAWTYRYQLRSYRRKLLSGLTFALPFLGVRVAYAILAAWSSSDLFGSQLSQNSTFARFNPIIGEWIPFLVMSVIVELVIALIYLVFSTTSSTRQR